MMFRLSGLICLGLCFFHLGDAQQMTCSSTPPKRDKRMDCGLNQASCQSSTNNSCCWTSTSKPNCYVNTANIVSLQSAATSAKVKARGLVIEKPKSNEPLVAAARRYGSKIPATLKAEIDGKARNFNIGTALAVSGALPSCPVNVPFCHRTACNAQDPLAERDPLRCLTDPTCCFDIDLFIYKSIFGPYFMGGTPTCYYGPTSSTYVAIARSIQPWNPFFQSIIINVFDKVLDTKINFIEQSVCIVSSFFQSLPFNNNPKCGWEGITKKECSLVGCCYDDKSTTKTKCFYPNRAFQQQSGIVQYYPSLYTYDPAEAQCPAPSDLSFRPSIFRRLPCLCTDSTTPYSDVYLRCSRSQCCQTFLAYFPQLASLSIISGGAPISQNNNAGLLLTLGLSGGLGSSLGGSIPGFGLTGPSLTQFYCPYFYFAVPGFPDLSSKVSGCCKIHACYHKKKLIPQYQPWGPWRCSVQCGTGTERRVRSCSSQGCGGPSYETRPCSRQCGTWSPWQPDGQCSHPCGNSGQQRQRRYCALPNGGTSSGCQGNSVNFVPCNRYPCASWSNWSNYGRCSAQCGNNGVQERTRQCFTSNQQQSNSCSGPRTDTLSCNRLPCASWSQWSGYSVCSGNCGTTGSRTRTRQCYYNNQVTNGCPGTGTQTVSCITPPCSWGQWQPWGTCQSNCVRTRSKVCPGNNCSPPTPVQSEPCMGDQCLQDPVDIGLSWGEWFSWTPCDKTCGNGQQARMRRCLYKGQTNSWVQTKICKCAYPGTESMDYKPCNLPACYQSASWSPWAADPCPAACGKQGTRSSRRQCMGANQQPVIVSNCAGQSVKSETCYGGPCVQEPKYSAWTAFGSCVCQNGRLVQVRYRCELDGQSCSSQVDKETRSCSNTPC